MSRVGVLRSACLVGNLCQFQPPYNDISRFPWDGPEMVDGIQRLTADLAAFKPNCILLLGATALKLCGGTSHSIAAMAGSIFEVRETTSPLYGYKVVPSFHPAFCLRAYENVPLLAFDVQRAYKESFSPLLDLPQRQYDLELTSKQIIEKLNGIQDGDRIAIDIEGRVEPGENISCISIATSPDYAFIVPLLDFPTTERELILPALARVLSNPRIGKILQNCLYDEFCLGWRWKIPVLGICHDTMLSGAEIYPELPKSLQVQTRIWTKEPYYKYERKLGDPRVLYKYCCTDSMVTYEIAQRHIEVFNVQPKAKAHFDFNMELLPAFRYMQTKGMRFDSELAKVRMEEITNELSELNARIDAKAGFHINPNTNNGPNALSKVLYNKLGYPPQYSKKPGERAKVVADADALLELVKGADDSDLIKDILKWKSIDKDRQQVGMTLDKDGRVRCSYNLAGAETFRVSCSGSASGSGTNLQTVKKIHRDLFIADEGYEFAQFDLSGADGWTVAAYCSSLGDSTMIDDYRFSGKFKPAKVIALMHLHGWQIATMPRPDLIEMMKQVEDKPGEWLYPTCKRVQHGSNYKMGERRMSDMVKVQTYKESGVPVFVSPRQCKALQALYLNGRYKSIVTWQEFVRDKLLRTKKLESASGHIRTFFGRENSDETWKEALAQEPQHNTTYVTNMAMRNLWYDPENRDSMGRLIVQPLHQVHDALCVQWPIERREWAWGKMMQWLNNTIVVAGLDIVIPADGGFGPNWKDTKEKL